MTQHICRISRLVVSIVALCVPHVVHTHCPPELTIIFVVDQLSQRVLEQVRPCLQGGLRKLMNDGVYYTQAHMDHGSPETAVGHAALNTGTYAQYHGIIGNIWYTPNGTRVECDADSTERAAIFSNCGFLKRGASAKNIMVDGISDQMMLATQPCARNQVFSISLKSRAAICTAGHAGKAIWFEPEVGGFTSSAAYFNGLPEWIRAFNNCSLLSQLQQISWELRYPCRTRPYNLTFADNYTYSQKSGTMIGMTLTRNSTPSFYEKFMQTPCANQLVLDCALRCIDENITHCQGDKLLLWVCLSALDKIGHEYGPQSREYLDLIYHLDSQLLNFMHCVKRRVKPHNILYVLTADHGNGLLPELARELGYTPAHRIVAPELLERINNNVRTNTELKDNIVRDIVGSAIYLNQAILDELKPAEQRVVLDTIKNTILNTPGIINVWTFNELKMSTRRCDQILGYFQRQLYKGRSGDLIIQTAPYVSITAHPDGISHVSPYNYDTHIPLIIYQRDLFERKIVHERVYGRQLPNTLAYILKVPQPSASLCEPLPGIVEPRDDYF